MQGIAKAVLVSIVVAISIMLFVNLIFFFPWYMTLVVETFNLSQVAANDNYIKESYYYDTLDRLRDRPIFKNKPSDIAVTAKNRDGYNAVGSDYVSGYEMLTEWEKPYRQRGEPITITIEAVYPLSVDLWGNTIEREIPVSFSMKAVGLKHYKDLDFIY